jgi:Uma2 family endonuclease
MNASVAPFVKLTPEEYLVRERAAEFKSEYVDGVVYAMSGASYSHSTIQMNLSGLFWSALEGQPCAPHGSDIKVWAPAAKAFFYPDILVVCGKPNYISKDVVENPTFVLEVLSPSTEHYDRTRKFDMYQTIPSLQQYALVYQGEPRVEILTRTPQGFWTYKSFIGLDAIADFDSVGVTAALARIYGRIDFDAAEEEQLVEP